ncbi:MAG TPA: aldehyde dehydrogenase family protein [Hypericibacter adhaerens]|jgi:sulfoacetaldehyde dehydrogenase|uniref:aldehyde dehydrogenase family protein n=1 Tax=Hypericibacter adhaerens TaxID=2602016 RepID=UPI002C66FB07|nr:aldehyde dehydrogenase family protein [Hypericibacter adhaerens]HWA43675.1 aldehyde dehydrogenase family protein [Hypericibacter adhaerens]
MSAVTAKLDKPAKQTPEEAQAEIAAMVARARRAQQAIENYGQAEADALVTAVGWQVFKNREALARLAVDEGGFGRYQDKIAKFENRVMGTLADMASIKTCGVVEEIPEKGLVKIAKPVGVIAALIPTTGPDATPPVKALGALKARNAIVVSPHPRTKRTSIAVVEAMRQGCRSVGAPEDLIQVIEQPSIAKTEALMRLSDLVVATGGAAMVKAAYSSGTPAYGVGVGNSVHVVDETADLDDAALMIARAKTFDYATSCLADNAVVAEARIYDSLRDKLIAAGGHLCTPEQKARLARAMWPDGGHIPTIDVVAKPAGRIAELAGFALPEDRSFLIVEEDGAGPDHPFSGEKLSVVLALYRYQGGIGGAIDWVNRIIGYQGLGHTCGIHTTNEAHIEALATRTKTARVMVNQNLNEGAGSLRNGMPYTLSLACGSWGGNITTENVSARHFMNLTWVSRPLKPRAITPETIFGAHWAKHGQ